MTYPFRFSGAPDPHLILGEGRQWDGLAARRVRASAGRHEGGLFAEHRLLFYLTEAAQTDCACEGLKQRRIQTIGDFDLVPAGAGGFWEDYQPVEMIAVRLAPQVLESTAEALDLPANRAALAPKLGARDPMVEHVARSLMAELAAPEIAGRIYADSLAVSLATRLLQSFTAAPAAGRQTLSKPQLRRVVEYVEVNLDQDVSLADVAQAAGISVPHLTTLFRRTMGQSVHGYLMERRVQRARALLLDGRMNITEVALESGFAHASHLARWMRRLLGVTPSQILRG